jgi:hypothetical protein
LDVLFLLMFFNVHQFESTLFLPEGFLLRNPLIVTSRPHWICYVSYLLLLSEFFLCFELLISSLSFALLTPCWAKSQKPLFFLYPEEEGWFHYSFLNILSDHCSFSSTFWMARSTHLLLSCDPQNFLILLHFLLFLYLWLNNFIFYLSSA